MHLRIPPDLTQTPRGDDECGSSFSFGKLSVLGGGISVNIVALKQDDLNVKGVPAGFCDFINLLGAKILGRSISNEWGRMEQGICELELKATGVVEKIVGAGITFVGRLF